MGKEGKGIKSVMMHTVRIRGEKGWSEDAGNGRKRKIGENGCPCSVLTWCESIEGKARGRGGWNFWLFPTRYEKIRR
ncbi:hypothetical protein CW713_09250 [Methanophagales archaeon]|nr:MAG: hypothetical protein CW713_09250 [Methanophagales archaeon]